VKRDLLRCQRKRSVSRSDSSGRGTPYGANEAKSLTTLAGKTHLRHLFQEIIPTVLPPKAGRERTTYEKPKARLFHQNRNGQGHVGWGDVRDLNCDVALRPLFETVAGHIGTHTFAWLRERGLNRPSLTLSSRLRIGLVSKFPCACARYGTTRLQRGF
jgi:hypothetical protein